VVVNIPEVKVAAKEEEAAFCQWAVEKQSPRERQREGGRERERRLEKHTERLSRNLF